jgi:NAD(P)-dependent dehydrogenase (short-subunit alcohol dehydrogenase family)
MGRRPTALVTGASRGIGKAIAIALAEAGYDVAITARTVHEGDGRSPESGDVLPGSLHTTTADIRETGTRCVPIVLDLLDEQSLAPAVDLAVDALGGRLDVLVNNAIYAAPGNDRRFAEVDPADIANRVWGNLTAQLLLTHRALHHMLAAEPVGGLRGTIIGIGSAAGRLTPKRPVGEGGWPLTYAAGKAGFHRIADMLAVEYGDRGIRAVNVDPGYVATERVLAAGDRLAFVAERGVSPALIGDAVVRLLSDPSVPNGGWVDAQEYTTP